MLTWISDVRRNTLLFRSDFRESFRTSPLFRDAVDPSPILADDTFVFTCVEISCIGDVTLSVDKSRSAAFLISLKNRFCEQDTAA